MLMKNIIDINEDNSPQFSLTTNLMSIINKKAHRMATIATKSPTPRAMTTTTSPWGIVCASTKSFVSSAAETCLPSLSSML